MKNVWLLGGILVLTFSVSAQNYELRSGKDIRQPGKLNPSLAGIQEDLIKVLTDADANSSFQLMLEGKMPFKLGNYMVGYERLTTGDVDNNMFNITYGRTSKKDIKKKETNQVNWRYGATIQIHQKSFLQAGYDSSAGYQFIDLNGETKSVPRLEDISDNVDYFNFELGGSMTYKNLIVGLSVENLLKQNVSLVRGEARNLPFTGNLMVGGFLNLGENITLFPSALAVYTPDDFYTKASLDFNANKFNFAAAYTLENEVQDLSGSIGFRYKKMFMGVSYAHPLTDESQLPRFNLFFNSTLIKGMDMFRSDFAKQMKKFY
jgi:hypothetical protein